MRISIVALLLILFVNYANGQEFFSEHTYTRADTLRGSITKERIWWDLLKYDLSIAVNPETQSIKGTNIVRYKVLSSSTVLQIDLQSPLVIDQVSQDGKPVEVMHEGNAHFIKLNKAQNQGETNELKVEFSGKPHVAQNAPWDGGFTWSKDSLGNHFLATSCQGIGASLWWPCKDHMYDEPDNGMTISVNVPGNLVAVSNGRLKKEKKERIGQKHMYGRC